MAHVLFRDVDLTSAVIEEPCFVFLSELFKVCHLLKPFSVVLTESEVDDLTYLRVRDVRRGLVTSGVYDS